MQETKAFLYVCSLMIVAILLIAGLYAAWPLFVHAANLFVILLEIIAVGFTIASYIAGAIWLYRFWLNAQIIRPSRHGTAQAIKWKGEIYEFGPKAHRAKTVEGSVEVREEEPVKLPPPMPTFSSLLKQQIIAPHRPLVIGIRENGELRTGSWLDLYTLAVAGVAGTGKSTSVLFYLLQAVMHNARLVLIDPHAETKPDSLARRLAGLPPSCFIGKIAIANQDILARVRSVAGELKRRQKTGKGQPIILVVDEFTRLMRAKDIAQELGEVLEAIAQEGRGYNIFALLTGQVWVATRTGGTELRYSIASSLIHRIQEAQASLLIPSRYAKLAPELKVGQALLYDTNGQSEILRIPFTTVDDVREIAGFLTHDRAYNGYSEKSPSNSFPPPFQPSSRSSGYRLVEAAQEGQILEREVTTEGLPEVHSFNTGELETVAQYIAEAKSPHEIVGLVWNLTGGREYQEKKLLVQQMTAYLVKQARNERIGA